MRFGQIMLYVLLGLLILAVASSVGIGLLAPPRFASERVLSIAWMLVGMAFPVTVCAMSMDRGAPKWLGWSGVVAAALAVPVWIWLIFMVNVLPEMTATKLTAVGSLLTGWSLVAGLSGGFLTAPLTSRWEWMLRAVVIALMYLLFVVGCMALILFTQDPYQIDPELSNRMDFMGRAAGTVTTLFCLGLLGMILTHYERKLRGGEQAIDERRPFRATCPRCRREQRLLTGGDECPGCGLKIKVTVI